MIVVVPQLYFVTVMPFFSVLAVGRVLTVSCHGESMHLIMCSSSLSASLSKSTAAFPSLSLLSGVLYTGTQTATHLAFLLELKRLGGSLVSQATESLSATVLIINRLPQESCISWTRLYFSLFYIISQSKEN